MEGQLYIRFRGRVLGPYDEEQLQALARRGQLSRLHELSVDGVSWQRASDYPELFVSSIVVESPIASPQASVALPRAQAPVVPTVAPPQRPGPQPSAGWYYMDGEERRGPVSVETLRFLSQSGQLDLHTMVWSEGMASWAAAGAIEGLLITGRRVPPGGYGIPFPGERGDGRDRAGYDDTWGHTNDPYAGSRTSQLARSPTPRREASAPTQVPIWLSAGGGSLACLTLFCPLISIPIFGSLSYVRIMQIQSRIGAGEMGLETAVGIALGGLAILAFVAAAVRQVPLMWIAGGGMVLCGMTTLIHLSTLISDAPTGFVSLDFGVALGFLAGGLVIAAAIVSTTQSHRRY